VACEEKKTGYERKPAEKVVIGDYLPFILDGEEWPLEVVEVEVKRVRVWITVEEPGRDERWKIRPQREERLAFKEAATLIEETEARLQEDNFSGP
jgi:hypothetical protein